MYIMLYVYTKGIQTLNCGLCNPLRKKKNYQTDLYIAVKEMINLFPFHFVIILKSTNREKKNSVVKIINITNLFK